MMVPKWVERFVGVPFADEGHDLSASNCWGIVHMVLRERAGIETPPHGEVSADDLVKVNDRVAHVIAEGPWRAVTDVEPHVFDVALIRGRPLHTGIIVAPGLLLHTWRAAQSMVMRLDHPLIRSKIIGFYRHETLA